MFGQVGQIIEGHMNELLNLERKLYSERKPICDQCKLKKNIEILGNWTEICSPDFYLNPLTEEISSYPIDGFKKGCGCRIASSTRTKNKVCPLGKW